MPATRFVIEPTYVNLTVIDGKPIAQPFTATLIDGDGARDVTAETTFVLADAAYGDWTASTLRVSGDALGPTEIIAAHGDQKVRAGMTVYARNTRIIDAPDNAATLFERATDDVACEPSISYPVDNVVVPQNGALDVQWADARNDLFAVSFATTYLETRIYTRRTERNVAWTQLAGEEWTRFANQHEPIALRVSGVVEADPTVRCTTAAQHVYVTDQPLAGNLYTSNSDGIYRFDATHRSGDPELLFSAAMWEAMFAPIVGGTTTNCIGCSLSADGSRFAVSSDVAGVIYDFTTKQLTAPASHNWSFATFNLNGSKLITSRDGDLRVITDDGTLLTTLASEPGLQAFDPQVSPDGRWLANVTATGNSMYFGSTIVTRQFFDGSNEMGGSTEITSLSPGTADFYPAWSPDGRWLAFTRATGGPSLELTASIWIVRADGSQPAIQLTAPMTGIDVRARFVPTVMSVDGEPMFYITFESRRAFGEQLAAGRMQLWAMPFYPNRTVGTPSPCDPQLSVCTQTLRAAAPAIRLPMQSITTDNRLLQWVR